MKEQGEKECGNRRAKLAELQLRLDALETRLGKSRGRLEAHILVGDRRGALSRRMIWPRNSIVCDASNQLYAEGISQDFQTFVSVPSAAGRPPLGQRVYAAVDIRDTWQMVGVTSRKTNRP
jgi:hypothetical protein